MSFDYMVTSGSVREGEEVALMRELAEFAESFELSWFPVNIRLICTVSSYLHNSYEDDEPCVDSPIVRDWSVVKRRGEATATAEVINGIVMLHPYGDWRLTWNTAHGNRLVGYRSCGHSAADENPAGHTVEVVESAPSLAQIKPEDVSMIMARSPIDMYGKFSEDKLRIETPWRRSDVAAAREALQILEKHSNKFSADDGQGVYEKGMDAFRNICGGYAEALGGKVAHPDVCDDL